MLGRTPRGSILRVSESLGGRPSSLYENDRFLNHNIGALDISARAYPFV